MAANINWTSGETLGFARPGSEQMAVAAAAGVVHLVWAQAKTLYHSRWTGAAWQAPIKVAGGEQPVLAVASDGTLYCAYTSVFLGNRDVYFSVFANDKWGLSQVVSRTTGASSDPAISVAPDGAVHLAWADTTPGYWTIYYGVRDARGWSYEPIPNGQGSRPTIAASASAVFVAWQDRLASSASAAYEVLATSRRGGEWALPSMVSDTRDAHSLFPRIAANGADRCHLVWQEARGDLYVIRHSDLWPNGWATPVDVSDPTVDARLGHSLASPRGPFQFVWSEGPLLKHRARAGEPQGSWSEPEIACDACPGLSEFAAAVSPNGELHIVYSRWPNGGERAFFYLRRKALEHKKIFLPVVGR